MFIIISIIIIIINCSSNHNNTNNNDNIACMMIIVVVTVIMQLNITITIICSWRQSCDWQTRLQPSAAATVQPVSSEKVGTQIRSQALTHGQMYTCCYGLLKPYASAHRRQ